MKTKENVMAFLASFSFSMVDMEKILGFLLGKGVIEKGEIIEFNTYKTGEKATFNDFFEWFEGEDDDELGNLLTLLFEVQEKAENEKDTDMVERIDKILYFLADAFELVIEEDKENE